jgi:hypothetical protein
MAGNEAHDVGEFHGTTRAPTALYLNTSSPRVLVDISTRKNGVNQYRFTFDPK